MTDLPVVCTLTEPELRERREGALAAMRGRVEEVEEIPGGYALTFPASDEALREVFEVVRLERACCAFLRFALVVPPGGGPFRLELTGPEGTKELLRSFFA